MTSRTSRPSWIERIAAHQRLALEAQAREWYELLKPHPELLDALITIIKALTAKNRRARRRTQS